MKDYEKRMAKTDEEFLAVDDSIVGEIPFCADHLIANGVTFADDVSAVAYNLSPTEQKWIPVTEQLPECDQVVLCYKADRGVRTGKHLAATYADGVSAFKDCCRDYAFGATHWMPLPKPPKGE